MIHQKHLDLLLDLDTDKNLHSGGALLEHLRGPMISFMRGVTIRPSVSAGCFTASTERRRTRQSPHPWTTDNGFVP